MAKQSEERYCRVYISREERRLLARIAGSRGVGRDYLALGRPAEERRGARPIPAWLGAQPATRAAARPPSPRPSPQERHCRSCSHLLELPVAGGARRFVCGLGVWRRVQKAQSVQASLRLRLLSLTCARYEHAAPPPAATPRHCRACSELVEADTTDERYVCARGVWTNPMKPQSVANARRLARLSGACAHFAPRAGSWIPRSKARRARSMR